MTQLALTQRYFQFTERQHQHVLLPEDVINLIMKHVVHDQRDEWQARLDRVHQEYRKLISVDDNVCGYFDCWHRRDTHCCRLIVDYLHDEEIAYSVMNYRHLESKLNSRMQWIGHIPFSEDAPHYRTQFRLPPNYVHQRLYPLSPVDEVSGYRRWQHAVRRLHVEYDDTITAMPCECEGCDSAHCLVLDWDGIFQLQYRHLPVHDDDEHTTMRHPFIYARHSSKHMPVPLSPNYVHLSLGVPWSYIRCTRRGRVQARYLPTNDRMNCPSMQSSNPYDVLSDLS